MDQNDISLSEITFSAFDESFNVPAASTSTPSRPRRNVGRAKPANAAKKPQADKRQFKVPAAPKRAPKNPPKATCKECGKGYVSLKYYKDHVRLHNIEKIATRYPSQAKVKENVPVIDKKVLERLMKAPAFGPSGENFKETVLHIDSISHISTEWSQFRNIVCSYFVDGIEGQKYLLPSHLLNSLFLRQEKLLTDKILRKKLEECLRSVHPDCEKFETDQNFICEYVLHFMSELLSFISLSVRGVNPGQQQRNVVLDSQDEQVIFHCGGAIMRGFLKKGKRYSRHAGWQKIVSCIQGKILESDSTTKATDMQKSWTEAIDRGSLLKLNADGLKFFLSLARICTQCAKDNGSLLFDDVIKVVLGSQVCVAWDRMVGDSLTQKESLTLMYGSVRSFSQTCGNGLARKFMNQYTGPKAMSSVSLRHRIAPKSN